MFRVTQCSDELATLPSMVPVANTFLAEATQLGNSGLFISHHFIALKFSQASAHFKQAIQSAVE